MPIYAYGDVEPEIDPTAYVHPDAVVIGRVTIGPESSVWPTAVLRGDHGSIVIGARTSVQDGTVVHTTPKLPTVIGSDCVVGHNAHLEGATIGDGCLVGSMSVCLNGVEVGDGSLIAAGALLTPGTKAPAKSRIVGAPAKVAPHPRPEEISEYVRYGVESYLADTRAYPTKLRRVDG
jgi:carbonic anhydrase/acetyltransferase-like protein (isoleucine patch superfamily)